MTSIPKQWLTWKRGWLGGGLLIILTIVRILVAQRSGDLCGDLIFGRWSQPFFVISMIGLSLGLVALGVGVLSGEQRARKLGQGILTAGVSLSLTMGLIGGVMRLTDPPRKKIPPFFQNHDPLGYFFTPNEQLKTGIWESEQHTYFTDSDGIVIREGKNDLQPDATRIMFLGDSFVGGFQVGARENMSVLTTDLLNEATGSNYQNINLGVDGFSPIRYYLTYEYFKDQFDPDIIVVVVYLGNDFSDTAQIVHGDQVTYDDAGIPIGIAPAIDHEAGVVWLNPSAGKVPIEESRPYLIAPEYWKAGFLRTVQSMVIGATCQRLEAASQEFTPEAFDGGDDLECKDVSGEIVAGCVNYAVRNESLIRNNRDATFKDEYTDFDQEDIATTLDALRLLNESISADGRQIIMLIMPDSNQIPGQSDGVKPKRGMSANEYMESQTPQELMADFCAAEGIACIDLLPALTVYQDEMLFWQYDTHLTALGHQRVAEILVEYLLGE